MKKQHQNNQNSDGFFIFIKTSDMSFSKEVLFALSDEEKIQLIHELRDSLKMPEEEYEDDISEEEIKEMEADFKDYKRNPLSAVCWGDFYKNEISRIGNDKK